MRDVSFGKLDILLKNGNRPQVEYLVFTRDGRKHKHKEYESFFVLSGRGKIYSGEKIFEVKEGCLVTISPETDHWMEVIEGEQMHGLLWYHEVPLESFS